MVIWQMEYYCWEKSHCKLMHVGRMWVEKCKKASLNLHLADEVAVKMTLVFDPVLLRVGGSMEIHTVSSLGLMAPVAATERAGSRKMGLLNICIRTLR